MGKVINHFAVQNEGYVVKMGIKNMKSKRDNKGRFIIGIHYSLKTEFKKGRISERRGKKLSWIGHNKPHSEETKRKISESHTGKRFSEEHKNNLKGHVPWNRGKTYNILRKLKGDCNLDYDLILFFYDLSDTDSKRQGYVLDALSENKTYDFRIFSLDRSFSEDPLLEVVKTYYNITMSPTLVINENKTDGFIPIDEIINKL